MTNLAKTIEACAGEEGCFGLINMDRNNVLINPIVFDTNSERVSVMVVTEQPGAGSSHKDLLKEHLDTGWNNRLPRRLVRLLGDSFKESIIQEDGTFYWTHFIKCPGNLRKYGKGLKDRACADKHLLTEISKLRPSLLISVGSQCSHWLLDLIESDIDWRDVVLDQLCKGRITEHKINLSQDITSQPVKMKIAFLFHPSAPGGTGWHIDSKLKGLLRKEIESIIK